MNIFMSLGLARPSILSHIPPLSKLEYVNKIDIFRNNPNVPIPKVEYHCPPRYIREIPLFVHLYKLLLMLRISKRNKPDLVISFYLVTHGLIGFLFAKIINKPIIICLIGTDIDYHCKKSIF